ncbi:MAG: hypothetical protein HBSAPP03_22740 [Phycisphaerae bacterium]|nr:MAG: hypothetical protein HBSAPP03_22740 [Phycisphaerae bacterium]
MDVLVRIAQSVTFVVTVAAMIAALWLIPRLRGGRRPGVLLGLLGVLGALTGPLIIAVLGSVGELLGWGGLADTFAISWATTFLVTLGLALAFVGWRADPARGRARCPKCWYDMTGTPTPRCPECGHLPKSERDWMRTRVSRPVVGLATLVLLGSYTTLRGRSMLNYGWEGAVPSTALIAAMPWLPERLYFDSSASLWDRVHDEDDLWWWQREWVQWRCRRLMVSSTSYTAIDRATDLVDDSTDPKFGRPIVRRLFHDLTGADPAASREAEDHLSSWKAYLPYPLPEGLHAEFADRVWDVLRNAPAEQAARVVVVAIILGLDTDAVARILIARLDAATDAEDRQELLNALDAYSDRSDLAWAHLMDLATSPDPMRRVMGMRPAPSGSRGDVLFEALEASLDHEDDGVVLAAARAILNSCSCKQPCEQAVHLLAVAAGHPVIHDEIVEAIVQRGCTSAELTDAVLTMLADPDPDRAMKGVKLVMELKTETPTLLAAVNAEAERLTAAGYGKQVDAATLQLRARQQAETTEEDAEPNDNVRPGRTPVTPQSR